MEGRETGRCLDGIVGWPVMHHVAGSQAQLAERFSGAGALAITLCPIPQAAMFIHTVLLHGPREGYFADFVNTCCMATWIEFLALKRLASD